MEQWLGTYEAVTTEYTCRSLNRVHVVPLASNVDHLYPSEAYENQAPNGDGDGATCPTA